MELMWNLIKERAESALKKAASEHETISDFCFMFVVYRAIVAEALLKIKECLPEEEKVPGKTCAQVLQFHLHKPLQQLGETTVVDCFTHVTSFPSLCVSSRCNMSTYRTCLPKLCYVTTLKNMC